MSNKFNIPKDKVLLGLRRLAARQKNGETFSYAEIAKECGVDEKAIRKAEAKAMEKLKQKLSGCSGDVVSALRGAMRARDSRVEIFEERAVKGGKVPCASIAVRAPQVIGTSYACFGFQTRVGSF